MYGVAPVQEIVEVPAAKVKLFDVPSKLPKLMLCEPESVIVPDPNEMLRVWLLLLITLWAVKL